LKRLAGQVDNTHASHAGSKVSMAMAMCGNCITIVPFLRNEHYTLYCSYFLKNMNALPYIKVTFRKNRTLYAVLKLLLEKTNAIPSIKVTF